MILISNPKFYFNIALSLVQRRVEKYKLNPRERREMNKDGFECCD